VKQRRYGIGIQAAAWRVGQALFDASTSGGDNPYIQQADLKSVAGYQSDSAMNEVMTYLAVHAAEVVDGAALFHNEKQGYRLIDNMDEQGDIRKHIGRVRDIVKKTQRVAVEAAADGNDEFLQLWSRKLQHMVEDDLNPYLASLDERVES